MARGASGADSSALPSRAAPRRAESGRAGLRVDSVTASRRASRATSKDGGFGLCCANLQHEGGEN